MKRFLKKKKKKKSSGTLSAKMLQIAPGQSGKLDLSTNLKTKEVLM